VILETYRECLQDVFDLPSLRRLLQGLRTRELDLVDVETASASPYSASLLFDYIATYMYEDDTPPAERRAQALSLDRDLLRELLGQEELRDLLDGGAVEEVEAQLRGSPRNADQLHDQLRLRGDLRPGDYDEGFAQTLLRERRALLVRFAGEERLIAAEDAGRYRDAVGVMPPGGMPEVFLEGGPESLEQSSSATRVVADRSRRRRSTRASRATSSRCFTSWNAASCWCAENCVQAAASASGATPTSSAGCDGRRSRRCARKSSPAEQAALGRFLPNWHGIDRRSTLREALVPLQGLSLPVSLWESEVLPRRVPGFNPGQLDQLCASGEVVWVGAGLDRVAVYFREDAAALGRPGAAAPAEGEAHDKIRAALARSAEFWHDLVAATELEPEVALPRFGISSGPAR
jgi:ATP-dependent Lhr-like helicase